MKKKGVIKKVEKVKDFDGFSKEIVTYLDKPLVEQIKAIDTLYLKYNLKSNEATKIFNDFKARKKELEKQKETIMKEREELEKKNKKQEPIKEETIIINPEEEKQKEARWLSDKATLDNQVGNKQCTEADLKLLKVLPDNYVQWKKINDRKELVKDIGIRIEDLAKRWKEDRGNCILELNDLVCEDFTKKELTDWLHEQINKPKVENEAGKNQVTTEPRIEEKEEYVKWGKFGPYVLVDEFIEQEFDLRKIKTIYGKRSEDVWTYDNETGIWKPDGKEYIKSLSENILGMFCKNKVVNEIFEKIKRLTGSSQEEFNNYQEHLLCLNNGVLNTKTQELLPFSPDYYFKTKQSIDYDKNAECPNIKNFIEETFYEYDIQTIQEWLGFHLYKRYFIKKSLILFGPKNTGKTVFVNLLTKFIGEKNKTGISLHSISRGDKFTLSFLKDKLANIYDDLSFSDLEDAGGFKMACGGGYITGEYKFGDTFEFMSFAKNTFATNKIPVIDGESDDAYYLRWLPIPCDSEIPEDEQDKFLLEKLTTKEEMSGLLNWALEGLKRLLEKGRFTYNKTIAETKTLMERHSNHLAVFVQDCLREEKGGKITKDEMYELYSDYAKEKKLRRLTKNQLGRSLEKFAIFITAKREKGRYWDNVGINPYNTTLTTLLLNLRGRQVVYSGIDMVEKNASYLSQTKEDTYNTSNQKDNTIDIKDKEEEEIDKAPIKPSSFIKHQFQFK